MVIVPGTRVDWIHLSSHSNHHDLDQQGKIYGSMGVGLNQDTLSPLPTCRELHLDRCSVTDSWNNENAFQNIDHRKYLGECVFKPNFITTNSQKIILRYLKHQQHLGTFFPEFFHLNFTQLGVSPGWNFAYGSAKGRGDTGGTAQHATNTLAEST